MIKYYIQLLVFLFIWFERIFSIECLINDDDDDDEVVSIEISSSDGGFITCWRMNWL